MCLKDFLVRVKNNLIIVLIFLSTNLVASDGNSAINGFIKNQGQVIDDDLNQRTDVLFTYEVSGVKMFFFKDKITYAFSKITYEETEESKKELLKGDLEAAKMLSMRIAVNRVDLEFVNANSNVEISFNDKKEHYVNFYRGDIKLNNVGVYGEVVYKNIYPNIDIVFKAGQDFFKYDIILHKGARISDIRFKYEGIDELSIKDKELHIKNDFVSFSENIPASYYEESKETVDVVYNVRNTSEFSFSVDGVSDIVSESIIIDPTLTWSTYFQRTVLGTSSSIRGNTEVDDNGNLFYQICTYSANLPLANPGGVVYYNPSYNPSSGLDIYFAKFDINRNLVWSTYLGGTNGTQSNYYDHGISFYGNTMYITGKTDASNFPLQNQGGGAYYQTYPGSGSLGFLSKFAITTGQMIHSTYVRVYEQQVVAADNNGNVVVVGRNTSSSVTPTILSRTGAYNQASFVGSSSNLIIYMFDSNMIQTWGTYFGGDGYIEAMGIDFDSNNNFFLFSRSSSNNASLPLQNPGGGAYYDNTIQGKYDLGMSKFSSSGGLVWSTYYGGTGLEGLSYSNVTVNESDEVIFTSQTTSTDINTNNQGGGAYSQGTPPTHLDDGWAGNSAGFFIKFSNNGVLQHATYIGQNNESGYIQDNQAGLCDRHYIIFQSKTFPTTTLTGSYNVNNAITSEYNYMLIEFEADLSIRWASYLHSDSICINRSAVDLNNGRLYCTGYTRATDFITLDPGTPAYFDDALSSWSGTGSPLVHAIMEFDIGGAPTISVSGGGTSTICEGDNITLIASGSGTINWYDALSGGNLIGTGSNLLLSNLMNDTIVYVEAVIGGCTSVRDSFIVTVVATIDAAINPAGPFCLNDVAFNLTAVNPGGTWSGTGVNASTGLFDPGTAGVGTHQITYTTTGVCNDTDTISIAVSNNYDATITAAGPFCSNDLPVTLSAVDPGGTWSGAGVNASTGVFDPGTAGAGTHQIIYTITGSCGDIDTIDILVTASADATITAAGPFCINDLPSILAATDPGGTWSGTGVNASTGEFNPTTAGLGTHQIIYTITGICGDADTIDITVVDNYDATITFAGPYCSSDVAVFLSAVDPGGTWSGIGVNASTGEFDPSTAGAGTHQIIYTITGSCGDADTIDIVVNQSPGISLTAFDESCTGALDGNINAIITGGSVPYTYIWSNGYTSEDIIDIGEGPYSITVTDGNGCISIETIVLFDPLVECDSLEPHIVIPNIFSPNADGENDILFARGSGVESLLYVIYDRWGEKIFESTSLDNGWDGTYKGREMDAAVFVYYIKARFVTGEEETLKGNVTLIR